MLDQNISTPLYEQLKTAIKNDIVSGIYKSGDRMPSEMELEKQYQVSRITVRRAIKELCDEEILIRRQGKGTFVLGSERCVRLNGPTGGFHDLMEQQGKKIDVSILEKEIIKVKPAYARDLQIEPDDDVVFMKRIMYADDIPVMIDMAYLPLKRFPGIFEKLSGNVALFRLMKQDYGIDLSNYYKVLKVKKATKEEARLLDCHPGDPLFDFFKITYDQSGTAQNISISFMRGEGTYYVISNENGEEMNQNGMRWRV